MDAHHLHRARQAGLQVQQLRRDVVLFTGGRVKSDCFGARLKPVVGTETREGSIDQSTWWVAVQPGP